MLSHPTINLFCVFGRTEQIIILGLTQAETDKTNTLDIFGSFILSVKGQNLNLGILQAFLQTFERTNIRDQCLCRFFNKGENLRLMILHNFPHLCKNITQSLCNQTKHNC